MKKLWWRLSLLGLIGVSSMILVPLEQFIPVKMDPVSLRLLALVQPALLVLALAALGAWLAPKVGLDAPVVLAWAEKRPVLPELYRQLPSASVAGLAVAAVLVTYTYILRGTDVGGQVLRFSVPLPARLLYGGLTEELLLRWGMMSLFVWFAWLLGGRRVTVAGWCYWLGLTLAGLLFAVGHLPTLSLLVPNPPDWLVGMVFAANFVPGLIFGWLFWRRGLEAAMMAHALAHLFAWTALLLI